MQFANIDLDQSLGEMFGFRRLEGKGNLSFAIDSSGDSVYELTRGLNGTASLVSRKGAISGINVEQLLKRMERSPLSRGNEFRTGKTPYDTLSVSLKITQGTATVEDIRVEGPTVRLGHGRLGIDPGPRPRPARHREPGLDHAAGVRTAVHGAGRVGRSRHAAGCREPDPTLGRRAAAAGRAAQEQRTRCDPLGDREARHRRARSAVGNAAARGDRRQACDRGVRARGDRKPAGGRAQARRNAEPAR